MILLCDTAVCRWALQLHNSSVSVPYRNHVRDVQEPDTCLLLYAPFLRTYGKGATLFNTLCWHQSAHRCGVLMRRPSHDRVEPWEEEAPLRFCDVLDLKDSKVCYQIMSCHHCLIDPHILSVHTIPLIGIIILLFILFWVFILDHVINISGGRCFVLRCTVCSYGASLSPGCGIGMFLLGCTGCPFSVDREDSLKWRRKHTSILRITYIHPPTQQASLKNNSCLPRTLYHTITAQAPVHKHTNTLWRDMLHHLFTQTLKHTNTTTL